MRPLGKRARLWIIGFEESLNYVHHMRVPQHGRSGFTLIELLVVIAIIGILSTLAVVALNSARQRSRDAKRVSDIRQIQTSLELGYAEIGGYPPAPTPIVLGSAAYDVMCVNGGSVFQGSSTGCTTMLMGLVPANPTPNGAPYAYRGTDGITSACTTAPCLGYCVQSELERGLPQIGLSAGAVIVDQSSLRNGTCP